jgi:hypothetical protein
MSPSPRLIRTSSPARLRAGMPGVSVLALLLTGVQAGILAAQADPPASSAVQPSQEPPPPLMGVFTTRIVAGGAPNGLLLHVQPGDLPRLPEGRIEWRSSGRFCDQGRPATSRFDVLSKAPQEGNASNTVLTVRIPKPRCWWPAYQYARITIEGDLTAQGRTRRTTFYEGTVPVSVLWATLAGSLAILGLIYPGCALVAWYLARRRYRLAQRANPDAKAEAPRVGFWDSLDPVEITANSYGRASLAKLQIFGFSLIVFGLLLYYQFRTGVLSGLSDDVLILLGISAAGTAGGRLTYAAKRRLALENWVWLRRKGWLTGTEDIARTAKWRDLVIDTDNNEFDTYSFQMAIFSLVVAVALVSASWTGLSKFEIPQQLLLLLGLSQFIYVGGKAIEKSPFAELDEKISALRAHEKKYQEAVAAESAASDEQGKAEAIRRANTERDAFKTEAGQAADMFWALYGGMIGRKPRALENIGGLDPDTFQPPPPIRTGERVAPVVGQAVAVKIASSAPAQPDGSQKQAS